MFTRPKVRKPETRDQDIISSRPRQDRDIEPSRPRQDRNVPFFETLETEMFNLQDWDKTDIPKNVSINLDTETFKTETTSLQICLMFRQVASFIKAEKIFTEFADISGGRWRTSGWVHSWFGGRVFEYLYDVPQHCDPVTPRVLKVDRCMSLLGNHQCEVLIKPPWQTHRTHRHTKQSMPRK